MKKYILVVVMSFLCFLHVFASNIKIPSGNILYTDSNNIYFLNLSNLKKNLIYQSKQCQLSGLSRINNESFLFTCDDLKQAKIEKFNLKKNQVKEIISGSMRAFLPDLNQMLYSFGSQKTEQEFIYTRKLNGGAQTKIIKFSGLEGFQVIPIGSRGIVFNNPNNFNNLLFYNVLSKKIRKLPIKGCSFPKIWRSKAKQLLCYNDKEDQYFMTSLDGKRVNTLSFKKTVAPVLYIPQNDQLFVLIPAVRWFSEVSDLWLYDFKTEKKVLIKKNISFSLGNAIYYEK